MHRFHDTSCYLLTKKDKSKRKYKIISNFQTQFDRKLIIDEILGDVLLTTDCMGMPRPSREAIRGQTSAWFTSVRRTLPRFHSEDANDRLLFSVIHGQTDTFL